MNREDSIALRTTARRIATSSGPVHETEEFALGSAAPMGPTLYIAYGHGRELYRGTYLGARQALQLREKHHGADPTITWDELPAWFDTEDVPVTAPLTGDAGVECAMQGWCQPIDALMAVTLFSEAVLSQMVQRELAIGDNGLMDDIGANVRPCGGCGSPGGCVCTRFGEALEQLFVLREAAPAAATVRLRPPRGVRAWRTERTDQPGAQLRMRLSLGLPVSRKRPRAAASERSLSLA